MTSSNTLKRLYIRTAGVALVAAAAIVLAVSEGQHPATYVLAGATAASLVWWARKTARMVRPLLDLRDRLEGAPGADSAELPAEYESLARDVDGSRRALRAMLRTCYSIAAAMNDADTVSLAVRREVMDKMGEIEESLGSLRGALLSRGGGAATGGPAAQSRVIPEADRVRELIGDISGSLEDMNTALKEVHRDARELMSSAGETSYSVSRLDSFLQDMVRSGKELESSTETANRVALEGTKVIEEMEKENEATIASVKKAAKAVGTLGMWSQEIGKIIQVIKDIADETNLLALNVAIIASQAGEHGKAFGVVAEEIRGLAERTSSSTKEISDLITTVQTSVANVTEEMKESVERVERGEVLVGNAGKMIGKISESFESARNVAHEIAAKTAEHRMDSNHVVMSFQNVAEIARKLDASRPARGAASGRGATAAQMLKVIAGTLVPAGPREARVAEYAAVQAGAPLKAGGGPVHGETERYPGDAVERGVDILDGMEAYLRSLREGLSAYFDAVGNTASLIRAIARQLHVPCGPEGFKKCWEEIERRGGAKCSCPCYGGDGWRCFLGEGVDGRLCADSRRTSQGCYSCPVFCENMNNIIPESELASDV